MRRTQTLFTALLSLILLAGVSCSTINKSHMNTGIELSIKSEMVAKVDVDMTRKLTGYASGGYLFHLFQISGDSKYADNIKYNTSGEPGFFGSIFDMLSKIESVKSAAAYNAIRTSDADVLVNPQYVIEEGHWNPFYKQIKVKVTGYAGRVVNIKNKQ